MVLNIEPSVFFYILAKVGPTLTKQLLKPLHMSWCLIYVLLSHLNSDMGVVNIEFFIIILFSVFQFFFISYLF